MIIFLALYQIHSFEKKMLDFDSSFRILELLINFNLEPGRFEILILKKFKVGIEHSSS